MTVEYRGGWLPGIYSADVSQLKSYSVSFAAIATTTTYVHTCRLREQLGSGQFGIVQHGIWSRRVKSETDCKDIDVAVKIVENGSKLEERVKFLQEAVIMGQFKNPYILQIFGIINEDNVSIIHILSHINSHGIDPQSSSDPFLSLKICKAMILAIGSEIYMKGKTGMGFIIYCHYIVFMLTAQDCDRDHVKRRFTWSSSFTETRVS